MSQTQTIQLTQPIATACVVDATKGPFTNETPREQNPAPSEPVTQVEQTRLMREIEQEREELARLLETVHRIADSLHRLHEETLAGNRVEIAKLAVEIARRILMSKVDQGDYEIQAIVEEALKQAPTRQNIVVRLHPEDLPRCQRLQREDPQSPFAELELAADWSIGRGECLVETPKGVVQSFIEQHLEHISEALQKVE